MLVVHFSSNKSYYVFLLQFDPHFFLDRSDTPAYLIKYVDCPNITFLWKNMSLDWDENTAWLFPFCITSIRVAVQNSLELLSVFHMFIDRLTVEQICRQIMWYCKWFFPPNSVIIFFNLIKTKVVSPISVLISYLSYFTKTNSAYIWRHVRT